MKLLIITNNPDRASFRQRVEIYLDMLGDGGIDCEVAALPNGELGILQLVRRAGEFDGVLVQKKCLNVLDAFTLRRWSRKIIYDFDDAIMFSPHKADSRNSSHYRLFERTMRISDLVIAGNSYLADIAGMYNQNVAIVPTGLDTSEYIVDGKSPDEDKVRLVWIGSKSTLKYLASIRPALEEIGKAYANVILRIVCDDFFELENMPVEKCLWSLERQAQYLVESDIGLSPLPDNSFSRGKCGFKILQYQAAGMAVIASSVGVNAEYVTGDIDGFHADGADDWIEKLGRLIEDERLRRQMGHRGAKHVSQFDSELIGRQLCSLISTFLTGDSAGSLR